MTRQLPVVAEKPLLVGFVVKGRDHQKCTHPGGVKMLHFPDHGRRVVATHAYHHRYPAPGLRQHQTDHLPFLLFGQG